MSAASTQLTQSCTVSARRISLSRAPTASANPTMWCLRPAATAARARLLGDPSGGTWSVTSNEPRRARSLVVRAGEKGDKDDRRGGGGAYPEYFLDMGPRIRKVFPDEPDFDPAAWDIICDVRSPSSGLRITSQAVSAPPCWTTSSAPGWAPYTSKSHPFLAKKVGASLVAKSG